MPAGGDTLDLSDLPIVDGHVHPLLPDPWTVSPGQFLDVFTEARPGTMASHVPHAGYLQRTLRALAERLGSAPSLAAVLERRRVAGAAAVGPLFAEARIDALLLDTGYPPVAMPLGEVGRLLSCAVHEIVRVETVAQALLLRALSFADFLATFRTALADAAARRAVGFKSVIAYRTGLAVRPWPGSEAEAAYAIALARLAGGGTARLVDKPLLDTLFLATLEVSTETGRPLQIHAGWGDPDVDLPAANPVLLRPILEDPRWADARIVVLHQGYPYVREAAFMATVWPQVHVDLSLVIPFLGPGVVGPLIELLSLAPATKLMYGSDVHSLPEPIALSAGWGRAALAEALEWLVVRGGTTRADAYGTARRILADNARALYRL
jgi:predicted TIM-barrel fold metal-dependent hydrolase